MSSIETKLRLKELTATTDWQKVNNIRRWGHPNMKTTTLAHIFHTSRNNTLHSSMKLQKLLTRFLHHYPQYRTVYGVETIGATLIMATAFYIEGLLGSHPLSNYLLYGIWSDWNTQKHFRDSPKTKAIMYNQLISIGVLKLVFEEADKKVIKKAIVLTTYYDKPNLDYISIEKAYESAIQNKGLGFGEYSFDK